ncbi:hypothetical protein PM004_03090 [Clostridium paraputrificum]|nr:hypothetical protein [Clostridium paraputrificum]
MYGEKARVIRIGNFYGMTGYILDKFPEIEWWEGELKLIEPKTEFTFEEVIARIKEGEVYRGTGGSTVDEITKKDTEIRISICIPQTGIVPTMQKYKLVPQKKEYQLYEVEHKENGKRYLFRSDLDHTLDDMVVCDTCHGKSYGKMVKVVTKELTEEEYKAYKPIVKIISKGCPF